jgi:methylmalonyl-CoA/ethylmalonyl-CoA epimerase
MKRRRFIGTVAGASAVVGFPKAASAESRAMPDAPVMELRVALTTQAFEKLSAFYRAGLGLEPSHVWPEDQGRALVLDLGRATLEVFDEKQAQTIDQIEVGRRVSGPVRFALHVPDLNAAVKRLQAHGATQVHGPVTAPWGDQTARFADPDGMQITLYQKK